MCVCRSVEIGPTIQILVPKVTTARSRRTRRAPSAGRCGGGGRREVSGRKSQMSSADRRAGGGAGAETDSSTHLPGAVCCIVGNFLISLSFNLQRRAHRDNKSGLHYTKLKVMSA